MITKIFKYGVAGGSAFVLDFALVYLLFAYTTLHYSIVVILAFMFGTFVNYSINHFWGFKETKRTIAKGYFYFLQIALIGVVLTLAFMTIMIEYLHIDKLFSRIVAAALVFIWGFSANYFFNFKTHKVTATQTKDVIQ